MANCLSTARIRAAADDEAGAVEREHLELCAECRAQVDVARRLSDELTAMATSVAVPESVRSRVGGALARRPERSGATTLRERPASGWTRPRLWTAGLAAAAVLVGVMVLPPLDAPGALSAAEILDRSLQTLSPASGTELREFDLDLQLPRIASVENGAYRIEQLLDHDAPGRYRLVRYGPDGALLSAISEDPAAGLRMAAVRVDGQLFAFRFAIDPARALALRDQERHHVEAMIRMLQAAAGQTVHEMGGPDGARYVVELPQVKGASGSSVWALDRARVVIDAGSFQILELAAAGAYMGESFSVSFRLRRRQVWPSAEVPRERFELPGEPALVTIEGTATEDLGRDLLVSALRELARMRR
jgi:hypothetical protein